MLLLKSSTNPLTKWIFGHNSRKVYNTCRINSHFVYFNHKLSLSIMFKVSEIQDIVIMITVQTRFLKAKGFLAQNLFSVTSFLFGLPSKIDFVLTSVCNLYKSICKDCSMLIPVDLWYYNWQQFTFRYWTHLVILTIVKCIQSLLNR